MSTSISAEVAILRTESPLLGLGDGATRRTAQRARKRVRERRRVLAASEFDDIGVACDLRLAAAGAGALRLMFSGAGREFRSGRDSRGARTALAGTCDGGLPAATRLCAAAATLARPRLAYGGVDVSIERASAENALSLAFSVWRWRSSSFARIGTRSYGMGLLNYMTSHTQHTHSNANRKISATHLSRSLL